MERIPKHIQRGTLETGSRKIVQHVIVCGLGRVGEMAVQELVDHNTPVVIVEGDSDKADRLTEEGLMVIPGDATRDENLANAGITRAKSVITTLPDDAQNLYVVLAAREKWHPTSTSSAGRR